PVTASRGGCPGADAKVFDAVSANNVGWHNKAVQEIVRIPYDLQMYSAL
ncbi:hypothetical protein CCF61_005347, partial [Salmonella enterica subsp. enterica serovar Glostrup]|nr:hypothetical protein [Salmonella enterica subsp. enterica serovar Glostrup]